MAEPVEYLGPPLRDRTILAVPGLKTTGTRERTRLIRIADRNDWNVDYLSAAVSHESGWNPGAENPAPGSTATGLMQFTTVARKMLGVTLAQLRRMSTYEQLLLVEKYFQKASGGRPIRAVDFLVFGLGAARCLPNLEADCILYAAGSVGANANPHLQDEDGAIRVGRMQDELRWLVEGSRGKKRLPVLIDREWSTYGGPSEAAKTGASGGAAAFLALAAGLGLALFGLWRYRRSR